MSADPLVLPPCSPQVCEVCEARVQGKRNLVHHLRNSNFPSTNPDFLPLIFEPVSKAGWPDATGTSKGPKLVVRMGFALALVVF